MTERAHDPFFTFFTERAARHGSHLVAELDGRLAGYIRVRPVTELRENAHVLGVMGLAVAPGARRRGVASALLAAAERHARDPWRAQAEPARAQHQRRPPCALYERLGFRREGALRHEFRIGGQYVDDVLMAKYLASAGPAADRPGMRRASPDAPILNPSPRDAVQSGHARDPRRPPRAPAGRAGRR